MKMNINEYVSFELSEVGAKIYNNWYADLRGKYPNILEFSQHKQGDVIKLQLWECFSIFGEHTHIGMHSFCEGGMLTIGED